MADDNSIEQGQEFGALKQEVHTLNKSVNKLFDIIEKNQPVPLSVGSYIGIGVSILTGFAILFGSVIYITNSSNAPMATQLSQTASILQGTQNNIQQNTSLIQLTNKEMLGIKNMARGNEDTLRWMIFDENIPKQITILQEQMKQLRRSKNIE